MRFWKSTKSATGLQDRPSLSFFQVRSNEYQKLLGTQCLKVSWLLIVGLQLWRSWTVSIKRGHEGFLSLKCCISGWFSIVVYFPILFSGATTVTVFVSTIFFSVQVIAFIMISGQMWNHIRNPPYAHRNPQTGEIVSAFLIYLKEKLQL